MKKIIALILATVTAISVFAGCGKKDEKPNNTEATEPTINAEDIDTNKLNPENAITYNDKISAFIVISNAKDSIDISINNGTTHNGTKQTIKGESITTNGEAFITKNVSKVDIEDRWAGTYNCAESDINSEITFTPKVKDNKLLSITCNMGNIRPSVKWSKYDSVTFTKDSIIVKNTEKEINISDEVKTNNINGGITLAIFMENNTDIQVKRLDAKTYTITSSEQMLRMDVTYTNHNKAIETDSQQSESIQKIDIASKQYTIVITDDDQIVITDK